MICLFSKFKNITNLFSRHVSLTFVYCFCWQGSISWNRVEKMLLKTKHLDADMVSQTYSLVIHNDLRVRIDHWAKWFLKFYPWAPMNIFNRCYKVTKNRNKLDNVSVEKPATCIYFTKNKRSFLLIMTITCQRYDSNLP